MAHAASASSFRSERMSPLALALAVLLHVVVVLALWWLVESQPKPAPVEDVIEVSFEQPKQQPKPPEPPPPPPQQQAKPPPPPPPPTDFGLKPPAAVTADKATQVPPQAPPGKEASAPQPPSPDDLPPLQPDMQPKVAEPAPPTPTPAPSPTPSPTPAPSPAKPPEQHALATPPPPPPPPRPPPAAQRPDVRPSPLPPGTQRRAPAVPNAQDAPTTSHFVNPADQFNRARAADNYLWQVAMKLQGYRYQANTNATRGTTVVRITIARNGHLLAVEIVRSSGVPEFDRGVLAGVRAGSPYSPLPADIQGESASFNLPLVSVNRN